MKKLFLSIGLVVVLGVQGLTASECTAKVIKEEGIKSYLAKLLLERCGKSDKRDFESKYINFKEDLANFKNLTGVRLSYYR